MPMTCSSISSRTAWISASLGAEGSALMPRRSARRWIERARVCRGAGVRTKADAGAGDVEPQDRDARDHDDGHEDQDQAVGSGHRRHSTQPGGTGLNVQVS